MFELIQVAPRTYYFDCPAKIGLYLDGNDATLIDSGNDADAGKKVWRILNERGYTLKQIFITHSHADHTGGCKFLQDKSGCRIYASGMEKDTLIHPIWEPVSLWAGIPPKALCHKFLLANPAVAEDIGGAPLDGWEVIPLPGHSADMVGYRTPDNILFVGDVVASEASFTKYPVTFLYDIETHLTTLEQIKSLSADLFVPSHASAVKEITALAELNLEKNREVIQTVLSFLKMPLSCDDILAALFETYSLVFSVEQYALVGCTLRSVLVCLLHQERIEMITENNRLLFRGKQTVSPYESAM